MPRARVWVWPYALFPLFGRLAGSNSLVSLGHLGSELKPSAGRRRALALPAGAPLPDDGPWRSLGRRVLMSSP